MRAHVFFDLDGTLTDPYEGITKSILYALERLDAPAPDEATLHSFIGPPLQVTFPQLVGAEKAGRALELYRERFADVGWEENVPYEGIHDALAAIRAKGTEMFVATTKPWIYAEKIVEHFGMGGFFEKVYGSELDGTRTDKTELLAFALAECPAAEDGVMIGDRGHDMIGGVNNNLAVVGVSYGYGTDEELRNAGATRIARTPLDIPSLLA